MLFIDHDVLCSWHNRNLVDLREGGYCIGASKAVMKVTVSDIESPMSEVRVIVYCNQTGERQEYKSH